jgi:hypothetical protein
VETSNAVIKVKRSSFLSRWKLQMRLLRSKGALFYPGGNFKCIY